MVSPFCNPASGWEHHSKHRQQTMKHTSLHDKPVIISQRLEGGFFGQCYVGANYLCQLGGYEVSLKASQKTFLLYCIIGQELKWPHYLEFSQKRIDVYEISVYDIGLFLLIVIIIVLQQWVNVCLCPTIPDDDSSQLWSQTFPGDARNNIFCLHRFCLSSLDWAERTKPLGVFFQSGRNPRAFKHPHENKEDCASKDVSMI